MEKKQQVQLLNILNSLFTADNLRKNVYIFKHLTPDLTLKFKIIQQERQVIAITHDFSLIRNALQKCQLIKLEEDHIKLLLKGEMSVIRVTPKHSQKNIKKQILSKAKDMKTDIKEGNGHVDIGFQSQAAANEFMERVKELTENYTFEMKEKDPYTGLQQSIKLYIKERNNQSHTNYYPQNYQYMYSNQYRPIMYQEEYPIFIRKAVDSDEEEQVRKISSKKYKQKQQPKLQLDEEDFPSLKGDNK